MKHLFFKAAMLVAVMHSFCAQSQIRNRIPPVSTNSGAYDRGSRLQRINPAGQTPSIFRNEDIFKKITTNPASDHHEGGVNDPQDGFIRLYPKDEYGGQVKEVVYHVFRQTARPGLNPKITVPVSGNILTIPGLRYASYSLIELHMQDGSVIQMDTTQPLYIYSAGLYAQPSGNIADYTAMMDGPNVNGFIASFNQNALIHSGGPQARGTGAPVPLGCNDGTWTVIWTSQGSGGGPIIVTQNSCGDRFVFECIQHNGPGVVAGDILNSNGGDPCAGTLVLTANFPSQTYRALPINPIVNVNASCITRNAATGANGTVTATATWEYLSTNGWGNGTIAAATLPVTYSWTGGGTGATKSYNAPGTYTLTAKIGSCSYTKNFVIGMNGYAAQNATTTVCKNAGNISLASLLTNEDTGGTWTRTSGTGGTFSASAGTFDPSGATNSVFKYTVAPTGSCAADDATLTINVTNPPNAGSDASTSVCVNAATTITLSSLITGAQTGGTWARTSGTGGTFNAGAGTFIPTNATTSTFRYIVAGTAPCATADTSVATVNIIPTVTAGTSGDVTVCANATNTINLAGLVSGETTGGAWTSIGGTGGTFSAAAGTFQPSGNGIAATRTFLYTVSNTCNTDTSQAVINIVPCCSLATTAAATAISCVSATSSVSTTVTNGSGNYTYSWSGPNGFTANTASFTTSVTGNYTVTVTDVNNSTCTAQSTVSVTSVVNNPVVVISGNNPVCTNSPVVITATVQSGTGVGPFTYEFSNNAGTILQSGSSNTLSIVPAGITSVIVKVTGANNCQSTQSITVNSPGPALSITNIVSICAGQSTTVSADNGGITGYTYLWTDNNTSNPVRNVTPAATTNYTVVRTTAQGCKDTATATVQVYAKPVITNITTVQPGCTGSTGSITVNATGDAAQLRYRLNGGTWQTLNVFNNLAAGNYTVSVGNTNGICNDTTTPAITLIVNNPIASGIAGPAGMCALEDGLFQVNPGVSGATYNWSATGSPVITGGITSSTFVPRWAANQAGATQTVTLAVSLGGCSQVYNKAVVINTAVFAAAGSDKAICPQAQVSIGLNPALAGPPGASFNWTPTQYIQGSSTTSSVLVAPPVTTNFVLTVTDPINGCSRKDTVTVIVDVAVNPVADAGPDRTLPILSMPDTVKLGGTLTTQPGAEPNTTIGYLWTAVNGSPIGALSATNISNPVFTRPAGVTTSTTYTYVLMVQKQYVGPSSLQGVTCPVFDTVKVNFSALPSTVRISPKVLLQGALYGNTPTQYVSDSVMRDNLRSLLRVPLLSPYPTLSDPITGNRNFVPVNNSTLEEIGLTINGQYPSALILGLTGNNAIVDWVFIELRSGANMQQVVATRSALIQRDGDVVDMDGFSPVMFTNITDLNCYVVVRHRNHLGVMTKNPLLLGETTRLVDFSHTPVAGGVATYGNNAQKVLTNNHLALWAGNVNTDRFIIYSGANNDQNTLQYIIFNAVNNITQSLSFILPDYTIGDVDMRGTAIFQGVGNDPNYISENVFNHPANTSHNQSYIIFEQVPPRNN